MYSEPQIVKIVADVIDSSDLGKWYDALKEIFFYNENTGKIVVNANIDLSDNIVYLNSFNDIFDSDENTIADIIDNTINHVLGYDEDDDSYNFTRDVFFNGNVVVQNSHADFSSIENQDGDNLQDALDAKSGKLYRHLVSLEEPNDSSFLTFIIISTQSTAFTLSQILELFHKVTSYIRYSDQNAGYDYSLLNIGYDAQNSQIDFEYLTENNGTASSSFPIAGITVYDEEIAEL